MRINSNSISAEFKNWITAFTTICIMLFIGMICLYVGESEWHGTIPGFFQFYVENIILAIPLYVSFVSTIILVIIAKYQSKVSKADFALKSVDFLPNRVKFNFCKKQYNFACRYSDINSLDMILKTIRVRDFRYMVSEIILKFNILNNKKLEIGFSPFWSIGCIYPIIDYSRKIKNFTYQINGPGEPLGLSQRINLYRNQKRRVFLSSEQIGFLKYCTAGLFLVGCIYPFLEGDYYASM